MRRLLAACLACAALTGAPRSGAAQVVSPGRLSAAHAELDGLRGCTRCHALREPGADAQRCLDCHQPLRRRIAAGTGFHADVEGGCGDCHREHLGRAAALVRLDTASFEHARLGFDLRGAHARLRCRDCHTPELVRAADVRAYDGGAGYLARTHLGLGTSCTACHTGDDPHGRQFGDRGCDACHDEADWEDAPRFSHEEAAFRLTGRHRDVACDECHDRPDPDAPVRWTALDHASCAACHRDPHRGAMAAPCRDCHTTEDWHHVPAGAVESRFDHDRTGFRLTGRHAALDCAACHRPASAVAAAVRIRFAAGTGGHVYPRPIASSCGACHLDVHGAALHGTAPGTCDACHDTRAWIPTSFDIARHAREAAFPLTGAHAAVPCGECHPAGPAGAATLRVETACSGCHAADDPHAGRYGEQPCDACHTTADFRTINFDHERAAATECAVCHAPDDPHDGQFGAAPCSECHTTDTFRIVAFDHARTAFALEGAHARAACGACHRATAAPAGRSVVRWRPLGTACADCHGGDR